MRFRVPPRNRETTTNALPIATQIRVDRPQRRGRAIFRVVLIAAIAVLPCASGSSMAAAQSALASAAARIDFHATHITEASTRFGIPEPWIRAVLRAESAGNVQAVSAAGAMGLMQVMPETWAGLRARYGLGRDPFDPRDNILAGTAYLREMWDRYGNAGAMLAAYNAGPARYDEHRLAGHPLPAETRAYVAKLVPRLGGAAASDLATRESPDWREAALFVVWSSGGIGVTEQPSGALSRDVRSHAPARDTDMSAAQGSGIFVPRSDARDAQ